MTRKDIADNLILVSIVAIIMGATFAACGGDVGTDGTVHRFTTTTSSTTLTTIGNTFFDPTGWKDIGNGVRIKNVDDGGLNCEVANGTGTALSCK